MHESPGRNGHATDGPGPSTMGFIAHPWYWWGPQGAPPDPPDLARLIEARSLSPSVAAMVAAAVHTGCSLAVVADPSRAGKTTFASAIAAALPADRTPIHLRGFYEDFAALKDDHPEPSSVVILANELSGHLPIYLWGDQLGRLADLGARGLQVIATAHAAGAASLVDVLTGPGASLPGDVARRLFDLVVSLKSECRVTAIETAAGSGYPLDGNAAGEEVKTWLTESSRRAPMLAAIDPESLPGWEAWARAPAQPPPDPRRPGAMLAYLERERARRAALP